MSVQVLAGNLFSCGQDYPTSDSSSATYNCGSRNLEIAFFIFFAIFVVALILIFHTYFGNVHPVLSCVETENVTTIVSYIREFTSITTKNEACTKFPETTKFLVLLHDLKLLAFRLGSFIQIGTIALYSGLKLGSSSDLYKTHTEQYWFLISGSYISGISPVVSISLFFVTALVYFFFRVKAIQIRLLIVGDDISASRYENRVERRGSNLLDTLLRCDVNDANTDANVHDKSSSVIGDNQGATTEVNAEQSWLTEQKIYWVRKISSFWSGFCLILVLTLIPLIVAIM